MGIEIQTLRLLLFAREMGVDFERSLMIGRQDLVVSAEQLVAAFAEYGIVVSPEEAVRLIRSRDYYSEAIFEKLGAGTVDSMDMSTYEGATVLHDLNQPLRPELEESYSLVFDGGTMEHIFDVPRALRTCMSLPQVGGHLILALPANNEMGHGFYQFGPDFFYRTLAPENGYHLRAMFVVSLFSEVAWNIVADPAKVRNRVGYNFGSRDVYLFTIAERTAVVSLFAKPPQQSDYAAEWGAASKIASDARVAYREALLTPPRRTLADALPRKIRRLPEIIKAGRRTLAGPRGPGLRAFRPSPETARELIAASPSR